MDLEVIPNPELSLFLKREHPGRSPQELDLSAIICAILHQANDFVPSVAGAVLLAEPEQQEDADRRPAGLVVVASFGEAGRRRLGSRVALDSAPPAQAFREDAVRAGALGWPAESRSRPGARPSVCIPLRVQSEVIGVLELVGREDAPGRSPRELELLGIFAQTISASLANAVEAQRSKEMARRDELTGLYNDRHMHQVLSTLVAEALAGGRECGLLFIDFDRFKEVNDVHGHLAGSRVLREMGAILRQVLPGASVPTRYGGDEFVIILPGCTKQELIWVAETVRQNIERHVFLEQADPEDPVNYPALRVTITCSIGLASLADDVVPRLGDEAPSSIAAKNELIRAADSRMYLAKELGRNRAVSDDPARAASSGLRPS